ncbi:hypothetical protein [Deinococcus soli (ex Cha et al. 2016)]|uniref:hypothetical protein n=1 Tax=Deinococcus soli (ex Cha et al. 2016) TaxID=1309411 RepID=UPI001666FF66|nr:hypothetical protein [Deinococcus soli (ex Cha et al. 2016)]GGB61266.1 hypothetical protein GCM10008019_16560 [Deinococcus soli (ex Cha et al. 2016)]
MTMKREIWSEKRHQTVRAVPNVLGEDVFLETLRKVKNDYVRLTDAETLHLTDMATSGTADQQNFARDQLARNAGPLLLEVAYEYSTRFGGLLEAYDGALHQLNKLLPRVTETADGKIRRTGWNPNQNGFRWLAWVQYKLPAEMPMAAERLVDDKRASGAPAAIASGRSRLLATVGNDGALFDEWVRLAKTPRPASHLPKGRKNLIVKKGGLRRVTAAFLAAGVNGKTTPTSTLPEARTSVLPLTPAWIARAVRANARAILARPKLSESTMRQARALATVTEFWVNRNAKAHRLDAVTGEDGDQRLADILTAEPVAPQRYEAPLHQLDQIRALRAYQRFGPIHGAVLTRLPVREILPVHRKRQQERQVRDRFAQFCEQAGIPGQGHDAIAAARLALTLTGTPLNAPMDDVREALRGVQAALRGKTAVSRPSQLGSALLTALIGTPLQRASKDDEAVAGALHRANPTLLFRFNLAAAVLYGRKLDRQGKADRTFVAACVKAGVRIKHAEDALDQLAHVPITTRRAQRVRVQGGTRYVRPMQLALEACAQSADARARDARLTLLRLEGELAAAEAAADIAPEAEWIAALDHAKDIRTRYLAAHRVSETLTNCAEALEESGTDLNLGRALLALVDQDNILDDHLALQNPLAWWADAWWACPAETDRDVVVVPF